MEKQNEDILAKNEDIEDDNRKLRQELHEIKKYHQKHNSIKNSSRKRDQAENEAEHQNERSNNKKARVSVSVASLPPEHEHEPESGHILEPPASFDSLDDDCLGNVLDFVDKSCYSVFGRVNKRCHEIFCSKGLPKVTYLFGYGPLHLIQRRGWYHPGLSKGVLYYNRMDVFDWMLADESGDGCERLNWLCKDAVIESRLGILREVFDRVNERRLKCLRDCDDGFDLCATAALFGNLDCLKFLRQNRCEWDDSAWDLAKQNGHEHILQYLRNNGYPSEWQN